MNKTEFADHIAREHDLTRTEAERMLNIITSSITSALSRKEEISLVGFGKFYTSLVAAREGRNPKTGASLSIEAYTQAKFSAGQTLKNACNNKDTATTIAAAAGNKGSSKSSVGNKTKTGKH